MAIRTSTDPNDPELRNLNSREKAIRIAVRERNANFFKMGDNRKEEPYDHVVGDISYLRGPYG